MNFLFVVELIQKTISEEQQETKNTEFLPLVNESKKRSLTIMENIALPTAGLVVVRENKLLLVYSKNKKVWYLPSGKIDDGKNSLEAAQREILEII